MEQRIRELVDKLNEYSKAYYVLDAPKISDKEYDELYDELLRLEEQSGIILPDSPTQRVGGDPLPCFEPHTHINRLWSLDKVRTREDLIDWGRGWSGLRSRSSFRRSNTPLNISSTA
ncbi:MAG: hypothetical protein ACLSES_08645 [Christensenellales bacterium]